jgi:hypothetical protein
VNARIATFYPDGHAHDARKVRVPPGREPVDERPTTEEAMAGTDNSDPEQLVTDQTRSAEDEEARAAHDADRDPTADEERDAPTEVDPSVAEHEREMAKLGAKVKGEGQIP